MFSSNSHTTNTHSPIHSHIPHQEPSSTDSTPPQQLHYQHPLTHPLPHSPSRTFIHWQYTSTTVTLPTPTHPSTPTFPIKNLHPLTVHLQQHQEPPSTDSTPPPTVALPTPTHTFPIKNLRPLTADQSDYWDHKRPSQSLPTDPLPTKPCHSLPGSQMLSLCSSSSSWRSCSTSSPGTIAAQAHPPLLPGWPESRVTQTVPPTRTPSLAFLRGISLGCFGPVAHGWWCRWSFRWREQPGAGSSMGIAASCSGEQHPGSRLGTEQTCGMFHALVNSCCWFWPGCGSIFSGCLGLLQGLCHLLSAKPW